jgi:flagellar hook-associated protein 1 FlgK
MALNPALVGQPDRVAAAGAATDLPGGSTVALQIAGLSSRALAGGTTPPAERFGAVAADLGVRLQAANAEEQLRDDTVQQAETLRESASGVSLDEEMVNLSKFQRAFEASTRVLRVADELLDTLMKSF